MQINVRPISKKPGLDNTIGVIMRPHLDIQPSDRDRPCPGTGALCAEAQADGVPCTELGRDCEVCERAVAASDGKGIGAKKAEPGSV